MKRFGMWLPMSATVVILFLSYFLYYQAIQSGAFLGLPTVACFNPAKPTVQNYSFYVDIVIQGKSQPLPGNIGHDYGDCLRVIHTNASGQTVLFTSNDNTQYTLGDFFAVWRKKFNSSQIGDMVESNGHRIIVLINGNPVPTFETTPIRDGEHIAVIYD